MEFSRPSCFLLQGIFPTQGLDPGFPHCRRILYQLSHKGSPKILEWVAYPFSSGSSQPRDELGSPALQEDSLPASNEQWGRPQKRMEKQWSCSVVCDSAILCTAVYQAPPSMEFSRQEYWSGLPLPSPGDLPDPRIEPGSPTKQVDALPSEPPGKPPNMEHFMNLHVILAQGPC